MRRMIVLLAIVLLGACDRSTPPSAPATADSPVTADSAAANDAATTTDAAIPSASTAASEPGAASGAAFTNRVWVRPGEMNPLGAMKIFLGDGTLLSDSCFETYRLSHWRSDGDSRISWQEDGIDIHAEVVSADEDELVLQMQLAGGSEQHRFVPATVPYLCPDMPR
jgi:hypothetical protein